MTASDKRRLNRVAELGCAICRRLNLGPTPAQIHHPRAGVGMGQKASHSVAIGLCHHHHLGPKGVLDLGAKGLFEAHYGFSEADLSADTRRLLGET